MSLTTENLFSPSVWDIETTSSTPLILNKTKRFHRFVESVEIVKRLRIGDHVTFEGREVRIKDVAVDPKPLQKPRPPMWIAANSDAAVATAAKIGDGWMIGSHSSIGELEQQVVLCQKAWSGSGKEGKPGIPIIREAFVANTRSEAIEKARPCFGAALSRHLC